MAVARAHDPAVRVIEREHAGLMVARDAAVEAARAGEAGAGSASVAVPIPRVSSLVGITAYLQAVFADSQAAAGGGVAHTAGLKVTTSTRVAPSFLASW